MSQPKVFRVTVAHEDAPLFLDACQHAQWHAFDTGERVMTDEGPDAEVVLLVDPVARARAKTAAVVVT